MSVHRYEASLRRQVPASPTREQLEMSFDRAMLAGAITPAVLGGLLLALHDNVVAHALDAARAWLPKYPRVSYAIAELEKAQGEERADAHP